MMTDAELLRRYAQEGSQEAFAELVGLRLGLVYSAALRQARGDVQWAQEAAQSVFTDLAAKAAALCRHESLIGWLYTSTRYAVRKMARAEHRRRHWEQQAFSLREDAGSSAPEIPAERLRPLLDDAMHHLAETDRRALLLRFFEGCSMAELGRSLGLSESAAQKRVERALLKLKQILAKRGLTSTAAALGIALSQEAAAASAPIGLAAAVSGSALATAGAGIAGPGLVALLTAPWAIAAGSVGTLLAVTCGVISYENRPGHLPAAGIPAASGITGNLPGSFRVVSAQVPELGEVEPGATDDRPTTGAAPWVRKPVAATESPSLAPPVIARPLTANPAVGQDWLVLPSGPGNLARPLQILDPTQVDQRPVPASRLRLTYPLDMRRRNIPGEVLVDFMVDADGRVHRAVAVTSSRSEFQRAAIEAVSNWRFQPGRKSGQAVSTHLRIPILFTLDSHD